MIAKRLITWFACTIGALCVLQIPVVVYWHFVPMERKDFQGATYKIHRGMGLPFGLFPVIGIKPAFMDEPVTLVITRPDGRKEVKGYDVPIDFYEDYPEVWPASGR